MFIASPRRLAALTAGGLASAALTVASFGAPAQAANSVITIDKTFTYDCEPIVTIGTDSASLGNHPVEVQAQSTIPSTVHAGQTIAPTPTKITLHMSDNLWLANKALTHVANAVDGSSTDSTLGVSLDGAAPAWVPIDGLSVKDAPIPVAAPDVWTPPAPWVIPTAGTVRAVKIPANATGKKLSLHMPQKFTAGALIKGGWLDDGSGVPDYQNVKTDMTCVLDQADDTLLGSPVTVTKAPATITSAKLKPKKVQAKKKAPKLTVQVASDAAATGAVTVTLKGKTVGTGTVANGAATIKLKKFKKAGKHKLTVTYAGDANSLGATTTVKVKVVK
ncbi:DUF6801 domain-containing protein [Pimelobacter simplex]|uniref:DUF6801 domain-containing protein n=1 Tax=Nocardioides simplex TaxID=2045 RepID=UPI00193369BF|nr:Ig-like domain repeat protein [Pimelobacter simplex]